MKFKLYLGVFLLAVSFTSAAQIITLKGKVTNAKTGETVPGASIISGSFGTSADGKGNFVFYIQQAVIEESGITVSSIGYQTTHLTDITDNYNVTMTPALEELKTVDITIGAEFIVNKANRAIRQNYINKGFNVTGIESMIHSVRDTFGYQYYYLNHSKVKLYMSAYTDTPFVTQVGLMEKSEKLLSNPVARRISFVNGYQLALNHDDVHLHAFAIKGNPARYTYKLNRKELIGGRKTYVVNFYSNIEGADAGIIYIDTATYAFVKILHTKYNVNIAHALNLDKATSLVQYRMYDGKWALDAIKDNSITESKGAHIERANEFQVGVITTENATQLPVEAMIKLRAVDDKIKPYTGFSDADKKMPKNIQKIMDDRFKKIKIPPIADRVH